jgi:hypothetical protein
MSKVTITFKSIPVLDRDSFTTSGTLADKRITVTKYDMSDVRNHVVTVHSLKLFLNIQRFVSSFGFGIIFAFIFFIIGAIILATFDASAATLSIFLKACYPCAVLFSYCTLGKDSARGSFMKEKALEDRGQNSESRELFCIEDKHWTRFLASLTPDIHALAIQALAGSSVQQKTPGEQVVPPNDR